jgi:hypothetical protein
MIHSATCSINNVFKNPQCCSFLSFPYNFIESCRLYFLYTFLAYFNSKITRFTCFANKKAGSYSHTIGSLLTFVCEALSDPAKSIMNSFPSLILDLILSGAWSVEVCCTVTLSSAWEREEVLLAAVGSTVRDRFPFWSRFITWGAYKYMHRERYDSNTKENELKCRKILILWVPRIVTLAVVITWQFTEHLGVMTQNTTGKWLLLHQYSYGLQQKWKIWRDGIYIRDSERNK